MAYISHIIGKAICPECNGQGRKESIFKEIEISKIKIEPEPFDLDFCHACYGSGKIDIFDKLIK